VLIFLNNLLLCKIMYPLVHMYMLNKLVNKDLTIQLNEKHAEQAMGVWLLDAIVNRTLREKDSTLQGVFHSLPFDVADPLQAGMKIHVYCDNLANYGTFTHEPDRRGEGFLSKRESKVYVPGENSYFISGDFRRRILQCGLDMLVVRSAKSSLKEFFIYSADWAKKSVSREKIYDTFVGLLEEKLKDKSNDYKQFIYKALKDNCDIGFRDALTRYSDGIEYMMTDWRRAKFVRDRAKEFKQKDENAPEENYCDAFSVVDVIQSNFSALEGWEKDIDAAVERIMEYSVENPENNILNSFSR
jgi:hypothetical protein